MKLLKGNALFNGGGHFPDEQHTLLLKAALKEKGEALDAFNAWLDTMQLNTLLAHSPAFLTGFMDRVDMGCQRLIPLVIENIGEDAHPYFKPLRGYIKNSWVRNQRIILTTAQLAKELQEVGIPTITFKGIRLVTKYYPNVASRPMFDGDLLIPFEYKERFLELLNTGQLNLKLRNADDLMTEFCHAVHLIYQESVDIDLHWGVFSEYGLQRKVSDFIWSKATNTNLKGGQTQDLDPTHEFFISLVHGRGFDPVPPIRWVADCTLILRKENIDWREFERLNEQFSYKPFVKRALPYLKEHFCPQIPNEVMHTIEQASVTIFEEKYYNSISMNIRNKGLVSLLFYGTKRRGIYYKMFLSDAYPTVWHYLFRWYTQRFRQEFDKRKRIL
jgi:hypothetical protein